MQALIALKKGAQLLKYGRKGKPKFCPFRLSNVSFSAFALKFWWLEKCLNLESAQMLTKKMTKISYFHLLFFTRMML